MIRWRAVSKSFDGGRTRAVDGVDLSLEAGGFLAVVGESGSGKSTLLRMVNRLVEPDAGAVELEGAPVAAGPAWRLRRGVGYVFQGVGLFPHLSVGENIAATPRLLRWERARIAGRVAALLELVRLPSAFADRRPAELSGGQRQRVGLARALAAEPRVVLLDEAFGALDPLTREDLGGDYGRLHQRLGLTTVMITHDVQEAVLLADRIAVMQRGALVAEGTPADLLQPTAPAYARQLLEAPRRQAEAVAARLGGLQGPARS